ncbi:hypothetical protein [Hymenobacter bucti]|uniref:Uncharacterized protein n=1 Tax=Hymenobacter bucti TaxID=1844114 RepID=A0ABW4QPH7_9BACT
MTTAPVYVTLAWGLTVVVIAGASLRGFTRFRQLPPSLRALTWFAGFETLMEVVNKSLIKVFHFQSNLFLLPLDAIGTVGLLALAYSYALQSAAFSRLMPWVLGAFSSYVLFDTLAGLGTVRYTPSVQVIGDLLMLSLAGLYFQKLLNELRVVRLGRDPFFWMSVGTVIYTLGDLQLSLFGNYILHHVPLQAQLITLSLVRISLLFVFYGSCCLALWMRPQR